MDSLTRFCLALREIALAAGEPPATRGFPPSVFAELPRLLERAGPGAGARRHGRGRSPACSRCWWRATTTTSRWPTAVRGILDGHVVLDRRIAERGRYPAIDVLRSLSRTARAVPGRRGDGPGPPRPRRPRVAGGACRPRAPRRLPPRHRSRRRRGAGAGAAAGGVPARRTRDESADPAICFRACAPRWRAFRPWPTRSNGRGGSAPSRWPRPAASLPRRSPPSTPPPPCAAEAAAALRARNRAMRAAPMPTTAAVEALAAWLPQGRAAIARAELALTRAETITAQARATLAAARSRRGRGRGADRSAGQRRGRDRRRGASRPRWTRRPCACRRPKRLTAALVAARPSGIAVSAARTGRGTTVLRIAMIGGGYVGLVSGACFAEFGTDVTVVEADPATSSPPCARAACRSTSRASTSWWRRTSPPAGSRFTGDLAAARRTAPRRCSSPSARRPGAATATPT